MGCADVSGCVCYRWLCSVDGPGSGFWFKGPIIQGSEAELSAIEKSVGETILVDVEGAAGGK